jgi:hypothetical protein
MLVRIDEQRMGYDMATVEERLASVETYMEHVATKADVAEITVAMAENKVAMSEIKVAMSESKVAMAEMKEELMTQLTWRMFGMVVGMFVATASTAAVAVAVSQTVFD